MTGYAQIALVSRVFCIGASDVNVFFLRNSRPHDSRYPAMIYIKTSFSHDCQCLKSISYTPRMVITDECKRKQ